MKERTSIYLEQDLYKKMVKVAMERKINGGKGTITDIINESLELNPELK